MRRQYRLFPDQAEYIPTDQLGGAPLQNYNALLTHPLLLERVPVQVSWLSVLVCIAIKA